MKFTSKNIISSAAVVLFFVSACSHKKKNSISDYGKVVSSVLINNEGAFRGFNLGDNLDSILAKELQEPMEIDDGFLYYEYKVDTITSFNITYNFEDKNLYEIQSDIFILENDSKENILLEFKTYFDNFFGSGERQKGFIVWTVQSEKYGKVRINLSDESSDYTVDNAPSKITLWIYPDKN